MSVSLYKPEQYPWQKNLPITPLVSKKSSSPKSSGEKWNLSVRRFPCKPWHKCDKIKPSHNERRAARRQAEMDALIAKWTGGQNVIQA